MESVSTDVDMVSEPRCCCSSLLALSPLLPCGHGQLLLPRSHSHSFSASASTGTLNPHLPLRQEQPGLEGAVLHAQGQQERMQAFLEGHTGTRAVQLPGAWDRTGKGG